MTINLKRLGGWTLIVGSTMAAFGYLAANLLAPGSGDEVYRYHLWPLFEGIAVVGSVIIAMGLPVILTFATKAPRLHLVGYAGLFAALGMLNIGEGVIEGFVKPYLLHHGGIPSTEPSGFDVFDGIALICLVVGAICLGIAMLRAHALPRLIGVALLVSCLIGALGLPGRLFLLGDTVVYATLFAIGTYAVRGHRGVTAESTVEPAAV